MKIKSLIIFLLTGLLCTCIDPYNIEFRKSETLLVVDALLTDEENSYYVSLSRTNAIQSEDPSMVTGASVSISEINGISVILQESSPGIYKTDSLTFKGRIGNSYTLSIVTPEGNAYESEACLMYPVDQIERIYYDKDQEIQNNGTEIRNGIRIFIDSETTGGSSFVRWIYNESWKILVPDPKKYDYLNDSTIIEAPVKHICWGNNTSDEIIIQSTAAGSENKIEKESILFIDSENSNRFLIRYSIEVKQLSLSQKEFGFWDQMRQINNAGGDIFDKQPFPVTGNIRNINNPDEPVLGYFQVSAVNRKRIYINRDEIAKLEIPVYMYECSRIVLGPDDYPPPLVPGGGMSFDKIYRMYSGPVYSFIEPIYDQTGELKKLVFSKNECADCTKTGDLSKPYFWTD